MPRCRAGSRELQCVAPYFVGGGVNVTVISWPLSNVRGRPERSSSNKAATPPDSYRARQLITVWREIENRRAISACATLSAANNTIRARVHC